MAEKKRCAIIKPRQWVLTLLLALVTVVRFSPRLGLVYTTRVYPVIGSFLSHVSGLFPVAIGDIFIFLSIVWVIAYPIVKRKRKALWRVAEYLLWVYAWFYLAWGLNYSQPNIYLRTGMKPVEVSKAELRKFAYQYADSINRLSEGSGKREEMIEESKCTADGWGNEEKKKIEKSILQGYCSIARLSTKMPHGMNTPLGINAPFNKSPHVKTMVFTPLSSMAGVTGSMGPFFCEFTLNGDIRPHAYPATYAHEFAHFLGVANEGEANFYSYIVCSASPDKTVRFSGYYQIFFHVVNDVFDILGKEEGERFLNHLRPEIKQLANSDRRYWLGKRSKVVNTAQNFIFDLYLRGNRIAEGRKSYSRVIALIMAWERFAPASIPFS